MFKNLREMLICKEITQRMHIHGYLIKKIREDRAAIDRRLSTLQESMDRVEKLMNKLEKMEEKT